MFNFNFFRNLKIGPRLAVGFGLLLVFMFAILGVSLYGYQTITNNLETISEKDWVKAQLTGDLVRLFNENGRNSIAAVLASDKEATAKYTQALLKTRDEITGKIDELDKLLYVEEGKKRMAAIKEARKPYVATADKVNQLVEAGKRDEALHVIDTERLPALENLIAATVSLSDLQTELMNKNSANALTASAASRNQMLGLGLLALVLGSVFAYFIARHITRATGQLGDTVTKITGGDYDARSKVKSGDEFEEFSTAFDKMLDERLAGLVQKEKDSELLNNSIIDILRSVAKTAQGDLTVHAPVREDITGALSDAINSMTDSTAKTLAGVTGMSHEVRSASQKGRDTVQQTSRGMNDIRGTIQETGKRIKRLGERSQEITGIVKLIDDIAERTSVLALNANMQAAMAGEAGRGFRVVADEVQRLAERSKEATDQIGKLVNTIQAETNDTMTTMDRAIGEVVKGGELADKAAQQVTHLDALGEQLIESVKAFKLPEELLKEIGSGERDARRAA